MGSPLGSPDDVVSTGRAVRDMFAAVAPRYDFLNHFLSLGCDIAWRKATATAMRRVLKPGGSVAILEFSQVRWPVFGPLFRIYFRRILPWLGTLISGVEGPYQYLPDSVARFPDQETLAEVMRQAGFAKVWYRNFFGG